MGGKIGAILLLVLVLGGIVYLFNSGLAQQGLDSLKGFGPLHLSGTSSPFSLQFPYSQNPPAAQGGYGNGSGGSGGVGGGSVISSSDIPRGFTLNDLSPYFHQVRFAGVSPSNPLGNYGGYSGQISLSASYNARGGSEPGTGVDVTGWQIKANHGGEFIPKAVTFYDPLGLNAASDIQLKGGDTLYLYTSQAPVNLRLNQCIGYLPNKTQFSPALPTTCPSIDRSVGVSFGGACQSYVDSLGGCQVPNLNDPRVPSDYSCREYLANHFNYRSCYDANVANPDFLSNQVWAWMGSSPLDPFHDTVELLDHGGRLVDLYTY